MPKLLDDSPCLRPLCGTRRLRNSYFGRRREWFRCSACLRRPPHSFQRRFAGRIPKDPPCSLSAVSSSHGFAPRACRRHFRISRFDSPPALHRSFPNAQRNPYQHLPGRSKSSLGRPGRSDSGRGRRLALQAQYACLPGSRTAIRESPKPVLEPQLGAAAATRTQPSVPG